MSPLQVAGDSAPLSRVADVLTAAKAAGVARLDVQLLLAHHLNRPRAWLLAHDDAPLSPEVAAELQAGLARRAAGEPLAYIIGNQSFRGLDLKVSADVLVPRPETEVLVDWALERLAARGEPAAVLDLGTGSGAIALAIKQARGDAAVCATDASPGALTVARANAERLGLEIEFVQGSWWTPLAGRRFDLVVANPPYVAAEDPHLAALRHEPRSALTPGGDGLGALRAVVESAPLHLARAAWLLLEHGHDQAAVVRSMLTDLGFAEAQTRCDLAGLDRCTGAQWVREKSDV